MSNALQVIIRHEKAAQAVAGLTHRIGWALGSCSISQSAPLLGAAKDMDEFYDDKGRLKSHLWKAFRIRDVSSCGWGETWLDEDGVRGALGEHGDQECAHCLEAFELIQQRKKARQELGNAKRAIRTMGRAALAKAAGEQP